MPPRLKAVSVANMLRWRLLPFLASSAALAIIALLAACADSGSPTTPDSSPERLRPAPTPTPAPPTPTPPPPAPPTDPVTFLTTIEASRIPPGVDCTRGCDFETIALATDYPTQTGEIGEILFPDRFWERGQFASFTVRVTLRSGVRGEIGTASFNGFDLSAIPRGWTHRPPPGAPIPFDSFVGDPPRPADPVFHGNGKATVSVGGYGSVEMSVADPKGDARAKVRIVLPGRNGRPVSIEHWALTARPGIGSARTRCELDARHEAERLTAGLWSDWRLPIPVDVVDNFPTEPNLLSSTRNGADELIERTYYAPVSTAAIMNQLDDLSRQIEEALGFPLIQPGRLIGRSEADEGRPARTQRFHVGYRIAPCGCCFVAACAHMTSGFISYASQASRPNGEVDALAHEILHLLGFKHDTRRGPYDANRYADPADPGVPMRFPDLRQIEPGQQYWVASTRYTTNTYYRWDYTEWDDSRYAAPEDLENLRCIFEAQR